MQHFPKKKTLSFHAIVDLRTNTVNIADTIARFKEKALRKSGRDEEKG